MSDKIEHAWGTSRLLGDTGGSAIYSFIGDAGGSSSYHLHEYKANVFIVLKGILELDVDRAKRRLYAGQSFTVPIGVAHRMTFITEVAGLEVYYTLTGDVDLKDIVRIEPGWTPDGQKYQQWQA